MTGHFTRSRTTNRRAASAAPTETSRLGPLPGPARLTHSRDR